MNAYYELKPAGTGEFRFNLKARNHEIILTSQLYASKQAAKVGIKSVQTNGPDPLNFDRRTTGSGQPYFVIKAKNHEIIGTSQVYSSINARDHAIDSVVESSGTGEVKDLT